MEYSECEKLRSVRDKSQVVGEFIEWLGTQDMFIARYGERDSIQMVYTPINELLAKFFNIDLKKVEAEKQEILNSLREVRHV